MTRNLLTGLLLIGIMVMTSCEKQLMKKDLLEKMSPVYGDINKTMAQAEIDQILEKVQNFPAEPVKTDEIAILETTLGTIKIEFFPDVAPNHCANFKRLANCGFYNGTIFHRVIPGFMIQGGDLLSRDNDRLNDGTGGPGYNVDAEFNPIPHERGIVSMARAMEPNSAGSQFFICVTACPFLNGQYTVFGKVIEGLEVIDKIVNADRDPATDNPYERIIMQRVYVIPRNSDL